MAKTKTLNKADRLAIIEELAQENDLGEVAGHASELNKAVEAASEALQAVGNGAAEAAQFHADRDWESRNSAIEEMDGQVEEMNDALDRAEEALETFTSEWTERLSQARFVVEQVREHDGHLMD